MPWWSGRLSSETSRTRRSASLTSSSVAGRASGSARATSWCYCPTATRAWCVVIIIIIIIKFNLYIAPYAQNVSRIICKKFIHLDKISYNLTYGKITCFLSVCLSVCQCVNVCMCVYEVCVCVCLSSCQCVCLYLSTVVYIVHLCGVNVCPSVRMSVCHWKILTGFGNLHLYLIFN